MKYKIAIVVHGRFYAFDLAKELQARGHDVRLFTNYPKWAVARYGFPPERVRSCWWEGLASRAISRWRFSESWLHRCFGRWAARTVARETWDAIFCFSGVSEELLHRIPRARCSRRWVIRASTHIRVQARLLQEEQQRSGAALDEPTPWMIAREEREYQLADRILTVSRFARDSFRIMGEETRVLSIPLGVSVKNFGATESVIRARQDRIRAGGPLRVLFVGTKSYRKGLLDLAEIARALAPRFEFRVVGAAEPAAEALLKEMAKEAEIVPKVPQAELPAIYAWGDLFIFPTIEDGFPVVLSQAQAAGLPILASTNCGASDFVREGETGWILPVRNPKAFIARLEWCDGHRAELADLVGGLPKQVQPRSWDEVAQDYEAALAQ